MPAVNPGRLELETAQEILVEVFGARPSDVEEMIRLRLEGRSWGESRMELGKMGKRSGLSLLMWRVQMAMRLIGCPKPLSRVVPRGGHSHPEPAAPGVTGKPIRQPHSTCSR